MKQVKYRYLKNGEILRKGDQVGLTDSFGVIVGWDDTIHVGDKVRCKHCTMCTYRRRVEEKVEDSVAISKESVEYVYKILKNQEASLIACLNSTQDLLNTWKQEQIKNNR
jgi:hypothetical protein